MADTERLLKLASFLETSVEEKDFRMSQWQARAFEPSVEGIPAGPRTFFGLFPGSDPIPPDPGCGFAGCAMGWAAHSGLFPGLSLQKMPAKTKHRDGSPILKGEGAFTIPVYMGAVQWDAIDSIFKFDLAANAVAPEMKEGLHGLAMYIFHQNAYDFEPGPQEVAARIREVVSKLGMNAIPQNLPEGVIPLTRAANQ